MWPRPWSSSVLREILPFSQTIVGMIAGCRSNTGGIIATRVHKHEREAVAQRVQCHALSDPGCLCRKRRRVSHRGAEQGALR
jgi:hypothetical protein